MEYVIASQQIQLIASGPGVDKTLQHGVKLIFTHVKNYSAIGKSSEGIYLDLDRLIVVLPLNAMNCKIGSLSFLTTMWRIKYLTRVCVLTLRHPQGSSIHCIVTDKMCPVAYFLQCAI